MQRVCMVPTWQIVPPCRVCCVLTISTNFQGWSCSKNQSWYLWGPLVEKQNHQTMVPWSIFVGKSTVREVSFFFGFKAKLHSRKETYLFQLQKHVLTHYTYRVYIYIYIYTYLYWPILIHFGWRSAAGNFRYGLREGQGQLLLDQQGTDLYEADDFHRWFRG